MNRHFLTIILSLYFGVAWSCHAEILPQWSTSSPRVKSVQWFQHGQPVSSPVTDLRGLNRPTLKFDILSPDDDDDAMPWLRASLEHRDADWNKDNLADSEFLDGFNIADIGTGDPSVGGITTLYRHYETVVPPDGMRPLVSGNYIIHIYTDNNPDSILLSAPFRIEEQTAKINATASASTDVDYKQRHQQLQLNVDMFNIDQRANPQDLKVYITQNGDPHSRRYIGFPSRISPRKASYEHKKELIFPAGNEYRRMETTDMSTPMRHVEHIEWHNPFYHQFLAVDQTTTAYLFDQDHDGTYVVRDRNSSDSDLEADYCVVHFTLDGANIKAGTPIFIEGDFTGRTRNRDYIMSYDPRENVYYKSLLLKQGAYDYKYVTPGVPDTYSVVEGDFHETSNTYDVSVYYRIPGERYDRLAVAETFSTY